MKASAIFTNKLMSNHTTKMTHVSIKTNDDFHFSQIWDGETPPQ